MHKHPLLAVIARAAAGLAVSALLVYQAPAALHGAAAFFVPALTEWTFPYLDDVGLRVESRTVDITASLHLDMTLRGGNPMPVMPVNFSKTGTEMMHAFAIAIAVWAAPRAGRRTRAAALPFTLLCAVLVCSLFLCVQIQETTLRELGGSLLSSLPLDMSEGNIAYFRAIESRYTATLWVKSFLDGGGMLFLAVVAGLSGHAVCPFLPRSRSRS